MDIFGLSPLEDLLTKVDNKIERMYRLLLAASYSREDIAGLVEYMLSDDPSKQIKNPDAKKALEDQKLYNAVHAFILYQVAYEKLRPLVNGTSTIPVNKMVEIANIIELAAECRVMVDFLIRGVQAAAGRKAKIENQRRGRITGLKKKEAAKPNHDAIIEAARGIHKHHPEWTANALADELVRKNLTPLGQAATRKIIQPWLKNPEGTPENTK